MYAVVTVLHKDNNDIIDTMLISDLMVGVKILQMFKKDIEGIYGDKINVCYQNVTRLKTLADARSNLNKYPQGLYVYIDLKDNVFYEKFIVEAKPIDSKGEDKYTVTELTHDGYDKVIVWTTNDIRKAVKQIKDKHSIFVRDTDVHKTNMRGLNMDDLDFEFKWADDLFYLEDRYDKRWYVGRIFEPDKLYI